MEEVIFIDTNILNKQNFFESTVEELLRYKNTHSGIHLVIPEIVYKELIDHMSMKVSKINKNIKEVNNLKQWAGGDLIKLFDKENTLKNYKEQLNQVFSIYYPDDNVHKKVFERYFKKLKPLENGKKEFKDALIWETILNYKENNSEVSSYYFLTNNYKDFAENNNIPPTLHQDFKIEFPSLVLVRDIEDYLTDKNYYRENKLDVDPKEITRKLDEYFQDHRWEFEEPLIQYIKEKNTSPLYEFTLGGLKINDFILNLENVKISELYNHIPTILKATINFGKRDYFIGDFESEEEYEFNEVEVVIECRTITKLDTNDVVIIDDIKIR